MHKPLVCLTVPFYTPANTQRKEEIYTTLEKNIEKDYIRIDEDVRKKALHCIEQMFEFAEK